MTKGRQIHSTTGKPFLGYLVKQNLKLAKKKKPWKCLDGEDGRTY